METPQTTNRGFFSTTKPNDYLRVALSPEEEPQVSVRAVNTLQEDEDDPAIVVECVVDLNLATFVDIVEHLHSNMSEEQLTKFGIWTSEQVDQIVRSYVGDLLDALASGGKDVKPQVQELLEGMNINLSDYIKPAPAKRPRKAQG